MVEKKEEVINKMEELNAKYLILQFTGADGQLKGVEMNKKAFTEVEKIGVDGSSIGFLRTKRSDMIIEPDPSTITVVPWQDATVCVFCNLKSTDTNERISTDPRGILTKISEDLFKEYEAYYYTRPEMEFYILTSDFQPIDYAGYMALPPKDKGYYLRKLIIETLDEINFPFKTSHAEAGPGQHEVEFKALEVVHTADRVQLFKQIAKMVTLEHTENWITTFMPKPFINEAGTGMHIHQIVKTKENNLFKGKNNELSDFALHFIGGQLKYASEIAAITNSTINSFRRLVPRKEAPVYKTWGIANRTALIRIPGYESGRLEYRCADASTNIYFCLALLLAAGLEGVKNKIDPPEEANFDADSLSSLELKERGVELLPRTLKDALDEFNKSKFVQKVLGEVLHKEYYHERIKEWQEFSSQYSFEKEEITEWEYKNYLDC